MVTCVWRGARGMALRSLRSRRCQLASLRRLIYTETGEWGELTNAERLAAERVWLERVSTPPACARDAPSQYVLAMFPYPSGHLHMGHVRVYAISDAIARFHRLQGKRVIHPMGWDAFGLPAENAALDRDLPADVWTRRNISHMRGQLHRMACCFDWDREVTTCEPRYYRWTQWLFLQLWKKGLVYRRQALVNWDPADGTVLADEQVDAEGRSWRSGAPVERRLLRQWFVRTTRLAQRLARSLETAPLRGWRDVIQLQKHWIGECDGWKFELEVEGPASLQPPPDPLVLWTADPQQFLRAAFIGLRSDHALASVCTSCPLSARDPATGRRLPLVVSDELPYPDGADSVLCSAEDGDLQRQLAASLSCSRSDFGSDDAASVGGSMSTEEIVGAGDGYRCSSKLHDWLISRQRYWGTPIPVVHCPACGAVPVPEQQLPVTLPKLEGATRGRSPLLDAADWLNTECPSCGGPAQRETDTMDTFVDSSWYYLRYLDPHNAAAPFDPELTNKHLPVDVYVGGKEHAVLHLYYARFIHHFLRSLGLVRSEEPFSRLIVQGQVMGQSYQDGETGRYLPPSQVTVTDSGAVCSETGRPVLTQWEKMSKSKLNGVDPTSVVEELGADTMRLVMLATVAPTSSRHWSQESFPPLLAWQRRLWLTVGEFVQNSLAPAEELQLRAAELQSLEAEMRERRNFFVRMVTYNYGETHQLSGVVHRLQGLTAALRRMPDWYRAVGTEYQRALGDLLVMTSPIMPCMTSEMWAAFASRARSGSSEHQLEAQVLEQRWPEADQDALLELVVEINGQESAVISLPRHQLDRLSQAEALRLAQADASVARHTAGGVSACSLELLPGIAATLRLQASACQAEAERDEVLRLREERKRAKKEKKKLRAEKKLTGGG